MRKLSTIAAVTVAALFSLANGNASAATINVPGDQSTISDAITAAASGDVIVVAMGTYTENLVINKDVTLEGAQSGIDACGRDGAAETIIDASAGVGIQLQGGSVGATIDGFTITNASRGIESTSGPIDDLTIQNNRIGNFTGSGIFLNDNGDDITLHQNYVDGTAAGAGGIVHLDQDSFDGMHITSNCIVNGEPASSVTAIIISGRARVGPHCLMVIYSAATVQALIWEDSPGKMPRLATIASLTTLSTGCKVARKTRQSPRILSALTLDRGSD